MTKSKSGSKAKTAEIHQEWSLTDILNHSDVASNTMQALIDHCGDRWVTPTVDLAGGSFDVRPVADGDGGGEPRMGVWMPVTFRATPSYPDDPAVTFIVTFYDDGGEPDVFAMVSGGPLDLQAAILGAD